MTHKLRDDCDYLLDSSSIKIIKTVAYSSLLLIIIVGNSLVAAVTCRNQKLQTTVHFLILNMAVSDIFVSLFGLPIQIKHIYFHQGRWLVSGLFGTITCKTLPFFIDLSRIVSLLTLEVIAVERFLSVVFPMTRGTAINHRKCLIIVVLIWLAAAVYPSLNFYKFKLINNSAEAYCLRSWKPIVANEEAFKVEAPILLGCFTVIPFLLLTVLYCIIILDLRRQKGRLQLASEERQRRARENKRVSYMLLTVVVVFLATWTPFNIYWFCRAYIWSSQRNCASRNLIFSANFMIYAYPTINPFIYFIFNENYRNGFRELLCSLQRSGCCKTWQRSSRTVHVSSQLPNTDSSNIVSLVCKRSSEVDTPM